VLTLPPPLNARIELHDARSVGVHSIEASLHLSLGERRIARGCLRQHDGFKRIELQRTAAFEIKKGKGLANLRLVRGHRDSLLGARVGALEKRVTGGSEESFR
jgi:hypothetical protein